MFRQLIDTLDLSVFLQENGELISDFSNADHNRLYNEQSDIENFIMLHSSKIEALNYNNIQNKAFLLFLFDISERLQLRNCIQQTYNWLQKFDVIIGSRLKATVLFNIDIPETNIYISRFNRICELLETALLEEDDNDKKILATFANYYLAVLDRYQIWVQQLRNLIQQSVDKYSFLKKQFITELFALDVNNPTKCSIDILELKDKLFDRHVVIKTTEQETNTLLIEKDSEYSNIISSVPNLSFNWIRTVAFDKVGYGTHLGGRGVEPLTSEHDLFVYLKSYGNMHYAKMQSAIELLPIDRFNGSFEIIDWGCGQALATISFLEFLQKINIKFNAKITLIEPSVVTIKRAALHVRAFSKESKITTVCKFIDDVTIDDFIPNSQTIKIHLFSNILDVELFSMSNLQKLVTNSFGGENYFVCSSPYIDDYKTDRVDSFMRHFRDKYFGNFELLGEETNSKSDNSYWNCNKNFKGNPCFSHPTLCGCGEKWTRVIRVFKVNL